MDLDSDIAEPLRERGPHRYAGPADAVLDGAEAVDVTELPGRLIVLEGTDGLNKAKQGHILGRVTMDLFCATDFAEVRGGTMEVVSTMQGARV